MSRRYKKNMKDIAFTDEIIDIFKFFRIIRTSSADKTFLQFAASYQTVKDIEYPVNDAIERFSVQRCSNDEYFSFVHTTVALFFIATKISGYNRWLLQILPFRRIVCFHCPHISTLLDFEARNSLAFSQKPAEFCTLSHFIHRNV